MPIDASWVVRVPLPEVSGPPVADSVHEPITRMRAQALALDGLSFRVSGDAVTVLSGAGAD